MILYSPSTPFQRGLVDTGRAANSVQCTFGHILTRLAGYGHLPELAKPSIDAVIAARYHCTPQYISLLCRTYGIPTVRRTPIKDA